MSQQRVAIYHIVADSREHLTAEEVFRRAKEQLPSIVLATVYNNLNALTDLGLIRRVRVFGQPDRYDGVLDPHNHLICRRCGQLADIELGDFLSYIKARTGLDVLSYELNLHYVCDECKSKEEREGGSAGE